MIDTATLSECDEEDVHILLLLDLLDLAFWTSKFVTTTSDLNKSVANLENKKNIKLVDLLIEDEREAICIEGLLLKLKIALKVANEDALELVSTRGTVPPLNSEYDHNNSAIHPLLAKLRIFPADMTTLEDFNENIQSSQNEKDKNTLVNTKGHVMPLKPPQCVELLETECHHRMSAAGHTNLLAPVTI